MAFSVKSGPTRSDCLWLSNPLGTSTTISWGLPLGAARDTLLGVSLSVRRKTVRVYMQDYGGPVGFRIWASRSRPKISSHISLYSALFWTTPSPNDDRTVAMGLMDFINWCLADETGRAVSSASIQETMAFNLLAPPQVRLLLGTRWFDFHPFLAGLRDAERERIMALTPQGDRIFHAEILNGYWDASRIRNVRVPREGQCYHVRSADGFNKHIAAFAS